MAKTISDQEPGPFSLIGRFSRSGNFPKDEGGIQFLAAGLVQASEVSGVPMADIVQRCALLSDWCPTDHELHEAAKSIQFERSLPPETRTTVYPPEALVTSEQWAAIEQADREHASYRQAHVLSQEYGLCGDMPVKRNVCACGWKGEWYPKRNWLRMDRAAAAD